jgi:hypothetical protein
MRTHEELRGSRHRRRREARQGAPRRVGSNCGLHGQRGGEELVAANGLDQGALVGEGGAITMEEMKRRYRVLQEQIRKLETVRAAIKAHGEWVPWRSGCKL